MNRRGGGFLGEEVEGRGCSGLFQWFFKGGGNGIVV